MDLLILGLLLVVILDSKHLMGFHNINETEAAITDVNDNGLKDGIGHSLVLDNEHVGIGLNPIKEGRENVIDLKVNGVVNVFVKVAVE